MSNVYDHDLCTYLSIFGSYHISSSGTTGYHCEFTLRPNGICFFKLIRSSHVIRGNVSFNIWQSMLPDSIVMTVYDWDIAAGGVSDSVHMVRSHILVSRKFFELVYSYALTKVDSQFTINTLVSAAVSFNTRFLVNGQSVTNDSKLDSADLMKFCTAVYLIVYKDRWAQGKVLSAIKQNIDEVRTSSSAGLLRRLWMYICNADCGSGYLSRLMGFAVLKEKYGLTVDVNPQYCSISSFVETSGSGFDDYDLMRPVEFNITLDSRIVDSCIGECGDYARTEVRCDMALEKEVVPGDGDCLYHSVIRLLGLTLTPSALKKKLLDSHMPFPQGKRDEVVKVLTTQGAWGNIDVLYLVSYVYGVQFCIHRDGISERIGRGKLLHIDYTDRHYSPLFPAASTLQPRVVRSGHTYGGDSIASIRMRVLALGVEANRLSLIQPKDAGYTSLKSLEFSEILLRIGVKCGKALLLNRGGKKSAFVDVLASSSVEMYGDSSYAECKMVSTLPTHPDKLVQCRLRIDNLDTVDVVASETVGDLSDAFIHTRPDTVYILRVPYSDVKGALDNFRNFSTVRVYRSVFSSLRSDAFYVVASGLVVKRRFCDYYEMYRGGIDAIYADDLLRAEALYFSPSFTYALQSEIVGAVVDRYLVRNRLLGGGMVGVLTRLIFGSSTDEDIENFLIERYTLLGIYDDSDAYPAEEIESAPVVREPTVVNESLPDVPVVATEPLPDVPAVVGARGDDLPTASVLVADIMPDVSVVEDTYLPVCDLPDDYAFSDKSYMITNLQLAGEASFKPKPVTSKKLRSHYAALYELIESFRITKYTVYTTHARILRKINGVNYLSEMKKHPKYGLLLDDKFVYNDTGIRDFEYKFALHRDGNGEFIPFGVRHKGFSLVSQKTELFLEPRLYDVCSKYLDVEIHDFSCDFVNGVPGCGKSTFIVKNHDATADLVIFPTRTSRDDFLVRMSIDPKSDDAKRYRTLYSYVLNSRTTYDRVWIDEALMHHPGAIILIVIVAKCKQLTLLGDRLQIPFINRDPTIPMVNTDLNRLFRVTRNLSVSYRCPIDIAATFDKDYRDAGGVGFTSVTGVDKTMSFVYLKNVLSLPKSHDIYLTFKQSEKFELLRYGLAVFTVHEFQGQEARDIALVRLSCKPNDTIYNSGEHVLVAMTRHRIKFTYYSMCSTGDGVTKRMRDRRLSGGAFATVVGADDVGTVANLIPLRKRDFYSNGVFDLNAIRRKLRASVEPVVSYSHVIQHMDPASFLRAMEGIGVTFAVSGFTPEVRNFVDRYIVSLGIFTGPTVRISRDKLSAPVVSRNSGGRVPVDLSYLQVVHDLLYDGSLIDQCYDGVFIENTDSSLVVDKLSVSLVKRPPKYSRFSHLKPVLRTIVPPVRSYTQMETLLALVKRNMAVPDLGSDVAVDLVSSAMFEKFKTSFLESSLPFPLLNLSTTLIREWLSTQPASVLPDPDTIENVGFRDLEKYNFTIKKTPKPKLDGDPLAEYLSLQTICYQGVHSNLLFCSLFREMRRRLVSLLKDRFVVFCDMSLADFEERLGVQLHRLLGKYSMEVDISKYDKSQGELLFEFELLVYRFLGMPDDLLLIWRTMHERTRLYDLNTKVKTDVVYQRKSGDAVTFFGNTVVLMGVLCSLYDMDDCVLGMFAGDDSLLFFNTPPVDKGMLCSFLFNLESKLFRFKTFYFCSKFLIFTDTGTYFVPDPVKLLVKLGRHDLKNFCHLREYVTSLRDLVSQYDRSDLLIPLSLSVSERYPGCPPYLHEYLYSLVISDDVFDIFYQVDGTELYPTTEFYSTDF